MSQNKKTIKVRDAQTGKVITLTYHDSLGWICGTCKSDGCRHTEQAYEKGAE